MKKFFSVILPILLLGMIVVWISQSVKVEAQPMRDEKGTGVETWVMGVTSEGSSVYSSLAGRMVTTVAGFRADRGVNDQYFIFAAPAEAKLINAASVNLVSLMGDDQMQVSLLLEIRDLDGNIVHTVTQAVDPMLFTPNGWVDFTLSETMTDLEIQPGEVLMAHLVFSDAGDLDLQCIFDIEVE